MNSISSSTYLTWILCFFMNFMWFNSNKNSKIVIKIVIKISKNTVFLYF